MNTAMRRKLKVCFTVSINTSDPAFPNLETKFKNLEDSVLNSRYFTSAARAFISRLLDCSAIEEKDAHPDLLYFRGVTEDCTPDDSE